MATISKNVAMIAIAVMTMSMPAKAQETGVFGVRAGFNLTNVTLTDMDGNKVNTDYRPGFQAGTVVELSWAKLKNLGGNIGIRFATQGYQIKAENSDAKIALDLYYLQIPVNIKYNLDLGVVKVFAQGGISIDWGLSAKMKYWDEKGERLTEEDTKLKFGMDEEKADLNMFDTGLGLGAGVQYSNMILGFIYNFPLMNMYLGDTGKAKMKKQGLEITLTYLFNKRQITN